MIGLAGSIGVAFGTLACGQEASAPCSAADAAAGRCAQEGVVLAPVAPGTVLPDWAQNLCNDWRRADGTCVQADLMADYDECLRTQGTPAKERLRKRGVGNRSVQHAGIRKTNLCLELRGWFESEAARARRLDRVQQPPPA